MAKATPFGKPTRMRILEDYFAGAGEVTADNAWEHVYRCLLWMNQGAGLAHIYDSNHMQRGGMFHSRAVAFTDALCKHWGTSRKELGQQIDILFKGCVRELEKQDKKALDPLGDELESELVGEIHALLQDHVSCDDVAAKLSRQVENITRQFFTIGNKRGNALGEGFEDLLSILLERVSKIPTGQIKLRTPLSKLPGFKKPAPPKNGAKPKRETRPDVAIIEDHITYTVVTAKWSTRQDRQQQFQSEYDAFQRNRKQPTELEYAFITNEFDLARLGNIARAMPGGEGGYIFHNIYHISVPMLRAVHGDRYDEFEHAVGAEKIRSLSDFLNDMRERFGTP